MDARFEDVPYLEGEVGTREQRDAAAVPLTAEELRAEPERCTEEVALADAER